MDIIRNTGTTIITLSTSEVSVGPLLLPTVETIYHRTGGMCVLFGSHVGFIVYYFIQHLVCVYARGCALSLLLHVIMMSPFLYFLFKLRLAHFVSAAPVLLSLHYY